MNNLLYHLIDIQRDRGDKARRKRKVEIYIICTFVRVSKLRVLDWRWRDPQCSAAVINATHYCSSCYTLYREVCKCGNELWHVSEQTIGMVNALTVQGGDNEEWRGEKIVPYQLRNETYTYTTCYPDPDPVYSPGSHESIDNFPSLINIYICAHPLDIFTWLTPPFKHADSWNFNYYFQVKFVLQLKINFDILFIYFFLLAIDGNFLTHWPGGNI